MPNTRSTPLLENGVELSAGSGAGDNVRRSVEVEVERDSEYHNESAFIRRSEQQQALEESNPKLLKKLTNDKELSNFFYNYKNMSISSNSLYKVGKT